MKFTITVLLLLFTTGCGIFRESPTSAVHDFGFPYSGPSLTTTVPAQQPPVTVEAPKWLLDNRIHYRLLYSNPTQVRFYTLDRWIATPPELFEQLLNSSGRHWVVPTVIRLHVFEQQFTSSTSARAVMHFTVTTTPDNKAQKPVGQDFLLQIPCPSPDAKGAVTGFTSLTKEAVGKIENWLIENN